MHNLVRASIFLLIAAPALASDGVLEIDQTCAVLTGCFPGDAPGFPVTISERGSYLVTSNLTVDGAPDALIDILSSAVAVDLDLNGFTLKGDFSTAASTKGIRSASPVRVADGDFELLRGAIDGTSVDVDRVHLFDITGVGISATTGEIDSVRSFLGYPSHRVIECTAECHINRVSGNAIDFPAVSIGSGSITESRLGNGGAPGFTSPVVESTGRVVISNSQVSGHVSLGSGLIEASSIGCLGYDQSPALSSVGSVWILDSSISCDIANVIAASVADQSILRANRIRGDIQVGARSIVESNTIDRTQGASASGIGAGDGSRIHGNSVSTGSTAGIGCGTGCLVSGNTVDRCGSYGLQLGTATSYHANNVSCGTTASVTGGVDTGGNLCNGSLTCP
ncbi:MAG: hypothetical protein KC616_09880 [Myxococcales bacterium]|nr:hypothetical protein [Myxococcales bacterium]